MSIEQNSGVPADDPRDLITPADNAEPVPESRAPVAPEPDRPKEEPKSPEVGGLFDDRRVAIAEKLKAARQAADKNPKIEIPDEMERSYHGPNVATRADRVREPEDVQTARDVTPEDIPAPVRHKLKVNGREIEVDQTQLEESARRALASDDILNEAKRARDEARRELAEIRELRAAHSAGLGQQPNPANAQAEDPKPATDAELDEIINAIQVGDQKEAALALAKHGDIIERRLMEKIGNIDERIAATTQRLNDDARIRAESAAVVNSFASENPDFSQSQRRIEVLFDASVEVMRENLMGIGVSPEALDGIIQKTGLAPQAAISVAYRKLRSEGHQLPDSANVLQTAAVRVRKDFGMPDPRREPTPVPEQRDTTQFVAERVERKQAMAPQPRRANVAPGNDAAPKLDPSDKARSVIANMRAYRRGR